MKDIHITTAVLGGAAAFVFAAADLWFFHSLAKDTDLGMIAVALLAWGVTGAYSAGLNTDPTPKPPPLPPV